MINETSGGFILRHLRHRLRAIDHILYYLKCFGLSRVVCVKIYKRLLYIFEVFYQLLSTVMTYYRPIHLRRRLPGLWRRLCPVRTDDLEGIYFAWRNNRRK